MAKTLQSDLNTLRLVRWLSGYALERWIALLAVLGTMLLKIFLDVLRPWPMLVLVDQVLSGKPMPPSMRLLVDLLPGIDGRDGLLRWTIGSTILLFLLSWMLSVASTYANMLFGQRMVYDLAADLFSHLQRLSLGFHSRRRVGDTIRRITSDCTCVSAIVKDAFLPVLSSLFSLGAMFLIMWRMDWGLTLMALLVMPLMALVLKLYARPMLLRSYQQQEVEGGIYNIVEQALSAIPLVQVFNRESDTVERFRTTTSIALTAQLSTTSIQLQFKALIGLCTAMGTAGILWLGAIRVLEGSMSVGGILLFLSYLASMYGPLESLMYAPSSVQIAAGSAQRVLEILDTEHDVRERTGAVRLARAKGSITFDNVSFGYEPAHPVLRNLSLAIPAGQSLAIVGGTGAGKSTLASLVPRLFDPWSGAVILDGHDLRDLTLSSLRQQISLVLQEPFLFPLSVAENIAYGQSDASSSAIEQAARAAGAHEFICRLPHGYQTVIGERGATLSGGERQRLSIARALLRDAPVLILDEPTSALDAATEQQILLAMRKLMAGRTTLMIAHRLSTVREADRIIVLEQGQVAEEGTHQQLIERAGIYAGFHNALHNRSAYTAGLEGAS